MPRYSGIKASNRRRKGSPHGNILGEGEVSYLGHVVSKVYKCVQSYHIVHFKYVHLILCQLYLNNFFYHFLLSGICRLNNYENKLLFWLFYRHRLCLKQDCRTTFSALSLTSLPPYVNHSISHSLSF